MSREFVTAGDGNSLPFIDPLQERQEPALNGRFGTLPAGRWTGGAGFYDGVLPAQRPGTQPRPWICAAAGREGEAPLELVYGISRGPVAVLCCCTIDLAVRIMSVTCGAKGTRTPDPLLAKPGQSVQHGRWPRMGVIERPASYGKVQARWCQSWVSPCPSMRTLSATVDGGRCCCSADRATRRDGDSRLGCRTRCCTDPPARLSAAARVAVLQPPAITV